MTKQEFIESVIAQRLEMIWADQKREMDASAWEKAEKIMDQLDPNDKKKMRQWLNTLADTGAENQKTVYLAGLEDGIWIMGLLLKNFLPDIKDK